MIRDNGSLQIDSDILTVTLTGKFTISGWTLSSTAYKTTLNLPLGTKFVLFGETGAASSIAVRNITITASYAVYEFWSNTTASVVCYCFGDVPIVPSDYGLQLYDTAGKLTFDSNSKFLKIAAVHTTTADTQSFSLPVGRTCACGISNYDTRYRQNLLGGQLAFAVLIRSVRNSGGQVTTGLVSNQGPQSSDPPANSPVGPMPVVMVADVTGY